MSNNKHLISVRTNSEELLYNGLFTDFSIKIGNDIFMCHKSILYCGSEFFKGYLNFNSSSTEITLDNNIVTFNGLESCLKYIYSLGYEYDILVDDIQDIYVTADFLQIFNFKAIISDKITGGINNQNAFGILAFTLTYNDRKLKMKTQNFINNSFNTLSFNCKEFLDLPFAELSEIILDKGLSSTDYFILTKLLLWTNHDILSRKPILLNNLSNLIQINLISNSQWTSLLNESDCSELVNEVKSLLNSSLIYKDINHRIGTPITLFSIGGDTVYYESRRIDNFSYLNQEAHINLSPMKEDRIDHKICSSSTFIFVVGGDNVEEGYIYRTCERYNLVERCWEDMSDLDANRSNFTVVALEGFVYLFGGYLTTNTTDNDGNINEKYKRGTHASFHILVYDSGMNNGWKKTEFTTPHEMIDAVATSCKGVIYTAGGENEHLLSSFNHSRNNIIRIYEFDPITGQWTELSTNGLLNPISILYCPSITVLSSHDNQNPEENKDCLILSISDGRDQNNRYSVYTYHFSLNRWRLATKLPELTPKQMSMTTAGGNGDSRDTRVVLHCCRDHLAVVAATNSLVEPFQLPWHTEYGMEYVITTAEPTSQYVWVKFKLESDWSGELDLLNPLFHQEFRCNPASKFILAPLVSQ